MAIATGAAIALAAGAGATAGTSIYSAKKQADAAKQGSAVQQAAADAALAWEKEQEGTRQKQYLEEREHNWGLDADTLSYKKEQDALDRERQARLDAINEEDRQRHIAQGAPFAQMAGQGANTLMSLLSSNEGGGRYMTSNYPGLALPQASSMQDLLSRR